MIPYPIRIDKMICPRLSPPPAKTPPIIRHGTQIMPPAQTAAMDSQLCRCDSSILNPFVFSLMEIAPLS